MSRSPAATPVDHESAAGRTPEPGPAGRSTERPSRNHEPTDVADQLRRSFLNGTRLLAGIVHAHNPLLGEHSTRVEATSLRIAAILALRQELCDALGAAARLHDIGMLNLSPDLTEREARSYSPRQFEEYRRHPLAGYTLVAVDPGYEPIALMIRHHHEAFDGGGFPDALRAEEIPLGARILTVADALDHLRYPRDGKPPLSLEQAFEMLERRRGTRLDPDIVNAYLDNGWSDQPSPGDPEAPQRVGVVYLQPGMVLEADLRASNGLFVAAAGTVLTPSTIERLKNFHRNHPILSGALVSGAPTGR